jgi:predicted amidophosphoribosyltransferase
MRATSPSFVTGTGNLGQAPGFCLALAARLRICPFCWEPIEQEDARWCPFCIEELPRTSWEGPAPRAEAERL